MFDPLPSDIFQAGQILNNTYEIEGVLGRGGTGEVFLARNQVTGRMVAIKALNKQFSNNDAFRDLLTREMQMRDILDDAVVRYTECSRSDQNHVFLVMDYIEGPSISDVMLQRRLEPRELLIIAHRVAEGLMAAHRKGIVHRDLSPDNVILRGGSAERATIIDFGIAKDTAAGARTIVGNDFAGKYEYAAPEQLEGRAEPRSDLYSLGAMLLAAFRGQVPFAGATPGEMVRRKQAALDTGGLPEPLKGLIVWLTEPKLSDRAPSADAVVARLNQALKAPGPRSAKPASPAKPMPAKDRRTGPSGLWVLLLPVLLIGAVAWGYYTHQFDALFVAKLPLVKPYAFAAAPPAQGVAQLSGNAPDAATAAALAKAYTDLTQTTPPAAALQLADGSPGPDWPAGVAKGLATLGDLQDWTFVIADMTATVAGIAPDAAARQGAEDRLNGWAKAAGFQLTLALQTGPKVLKGADIDAAMAALSDCGPLDRGTPPPDTYKLGDTISATGSASSADKSKAMQKALFDMVGDRGVDVRMQVLNPPICLIRPLLPTTPPNGMSIRLTQGATDQANPSGVFHVGDNPVIDILVPASFAGSRLDVFVVSEDGGVLNLMPSVYHEDNLIDTLGTVENGVRTVRVAFSAGDANIPEKMPQMVFNDKSFGKNQIVAILSRNGLFDLRRPGQETVEGLTEALTKIHDQMQGNVLAFAATVMESRP